MNLVLSFHADSPQTHESPLDTACSLPLSARPSLILSRMSADDNPWALAVVDEDPTTPHLLGWITQQSLVKKIATQQMRAIAAGHKTSWGSRWKEHHSHASGHVD